MVHARLPDNYDDDVDNNIPIHEEQVQIGGNTRTHPFLVQKSECGGFDDQELRQF